MTRDHADAWITFSCTYIRVSDNDNGEDMSGARPGGPDDADNVRLNEGRGRFYVEAKSIGGGTIL